MAITPNDIQFHAADRNDDTSMGGGLMTATVIENGAIGQLFGVVSDLDRAGGNVSLRKVFGGVFNEETDTYYGTYALISKIPEDPNISATLCQQGEWSDRRTDAVNNLENYLIFGSVANYVVYGLHLAGTKVIRLLAKVTSPNPSIGKSYVLSQYEGLQTAFYQFIRIKSLTTYTEEFIVDEKAFTLKIITAEITSALLYDFTGGTPSKEMTQGACILRNTMIADAAKYYGITTLTNSANISDTSIKVDSIYTQLIPTSLAENILTDEKLGIATCAIQSGSKITFTLTADYGGQNKIYLKSPCVTGSVKITASGNIWVTKGNYLYRSDVRCGVIDPIDGVVTFDDTITVSSSGTIEYLPASVIDLLTTNYYVKITEQNRGFNWLYTFSKEAVKGTVSVEYCVLNDWYRLSDDGNGVLVGESEGIGSGIVTYSNGYIQFTATALPDIDSYIIFNIAVASQLTLFEDLNTTLIIDNPTFQLAHVPNSSSTTITYYEDSQLKTATDVGAGVLKIGQATVGSLNYYKRLITLNNIIDYNTTVTVNYEYKIYNSQSDDKSETFTLNNDGELDNTLTYTPILPNSVYLKWDVGSGLNDTPFYPIYYSANDNGDGEIIGDYTYPLISENSLVENGTIDYETGTIYAIPRFIKSQRVIVNNNYQQILSGTTNPSQKSQLTIYYKIDNENSTNEEYEETFTYYGIQGRLSSIRAPKINSSSALFTVNDVEYLNGGDGNLYRSFNHITNAKTLAGTINYRDRTFNITSYTTGPLSSSIQSVLFNEPFGQYIGDGITRLSNAPIKPNSLQISAYGLTSGHTISAIANVDGILESEDNITGQILHSHGLLEVNFGEQVLADTITINAISLSSIPVNEEIIGLSTTRLPIDGRVPMIRDGDYILLHNEQTTELTDIVENTPFELRPRIESCYVIDANEDQINELLYTVDKIAGTVTVLNLTGLQTPLSAVHRITDLMVANDARIDGTIKLTRSITHNYPSGSYVSSCLTIGNKQAVIYKIWPETTWVNDWEEVLHGDEPIFNFDYVHYPITTTNSGAEDDHLAIIFTNTTAFKVISKNRGQIASWNTANDLTLENPAGGTLLYINHLGWGSGWVTGGVLRIIIHAVHSPLWIARTVMPSDTSDDVHSICCELRGNVAVE